MEKTQDHRHYTELSAENTHTPPLRMEAVPSEPRSARRPATTPNPPAGSPYLSEQPPAGSRRSRTAPSAPICSGAARGAGSLCHAGVPGVEAMRERGAAALQCWDQPG